MSGRSKALERAGLLNFDAPEWGEMASGRNKDLRATWCAGDYCAGHVLTGLQVIHIGASYLTKCPNCQGKNLYFDQVSPARARRLQLQLDSWLTTQRKRKAKK